MIKTFGNKVAEAVFNAFNNREARKIPTELHKIAKRKLDMIDYVTALQQLSIPPGNHLEVLKGDYAGYYSIRINDQWRILFKWEEDNAYNVKIIDYH